MTAEQIAAVVEANIHKIVALTSRSGEVEIVVILNIDDEGFVYRLHAPKEWEYKGECWTEFGEATEVNPAHAEENST
jgi:hypothetical protein